MSLTTIRKNLIPPLLPHFHKGQLGKLAVIGGCEDYTGAPFFSAHAAMLAGVDLVHVICDDHVAPVIKGYSPDLMVHPYLRSGNIEDADDFSVRMRKIKGIIDRMDVVVIGPGFGRDDSGMFKFLTNIMKYSVDIEGMSIILDADALYHLSTSELLKELVMQSKSDIVITPNFMEFKRLNEAFNTKDIWELSRLLKCTVVQKGESDFICNGKNKYECLYPGSLKRVGGQGDSLTGIIGAFLCWKNAYKKKLYKFQDVLDDDELILLGCQGACTVTRKAGCKAYTKYGRGMLTSNLHEFIADAIYHL